MCDSVEFECVIHVCASAVGELTDNLYGTGALSATACLPDPLSSEASGEWHPQVGAPPPVGQLMQEAPELSGYSQPIMPRLAEPEFGLEPPSQGAPQHPGLLPIQGDSYYHPPADASASLSSPPTEAQGQDGGQRSQPAHNIVPF